MSTKKIIIREKRSAPPSAAQLEYLRNMKAEIVGEKSLETHRIAVQISDTAFVLCDPEEKESYAQKNE